jgi:glycosyltransferase involved in cell wall biosynthesis
MCLVSILIPVYNREQLLGSCIQSALNQTVADLEVIISDNASIDGTWEVCKEFANRDHRVRIFRNETNIGPVRNWQRCFAEAKGTYGKILFSDDLMNPDFLEKTLPYMDDQEVGFAFTMTEIGARPGTGQLVYKWADNSKKFPSKRFIYDALFGGYRVPVSPGAALFRLTDLRKNLMITVPSPSFDDFLDHGMGVDLLLYLITATHYPNIAFVNEPLVFFMSHPGSISVSSKLSVLFERYTQARIWFAMNYGDAKLAEQCVTWFWLSDCKRKKVLTNPDKFIRIYFPDTKVGVTLQAIIWALALKIKRKLKTIFTV